MAEASADFGSLQHRVQVMEDKWAILELVSAYGPAVDSGNADAAADLWFENGVYDVDSGILQGRGEIRAMVHGVLHQGFISNGAAHTMSLPHIELYGDQAVATSHSLLVLKVAAGPLFSVFRITANRWELNKVDGQWRVQRRIGRLLDGRPVAREVLGAAGAMSFDLDGRPIDGGRCDKQQSG